jgi:amino acid transporter
MNIEKQTLSEWLLGIIIVTGLILLMDPFNFLMTSAVTLTAIMILAVAIISFAVFVWREKPKDEREAFYGLKAGHVSYFAGGGVLVTAIIVQAAQHHLDKWLAATLGIMVITKLIVSAWTRRK